MQIDNHFATNKSGIGLRRSIFDLTHKHLTSGNASHLIPFDMYEVLPGSTYNINVNGLIRSMTPFAPVLDSAFIDLYYFFVPNRLIWDHWKEFMGENTESYWYPASTYTVPQLKFKESGGSTNPSMLDPSSPLSYLGVPPNVDLTNVEVNALPMRALTLIYNEWFRDERTQSPYYLFKGDGYSYIHSWEVNIFTGFTPFIVNKFHDYFTSANPSAQSGPAVDIPMLGNAPLVVKNNSSYNFNLSPSTLNIASAQGILAPGQTIGVGVGDSLTGQQSNINVYADLSQATTATINALRIAFQTQKYYEALARSGRRYTEILSSIFQVSSPDSRQQRPEYLGGERIRLGTYQVLQNSGSTNSTTPLGTTGAYGLTAFEHACPSTYSSTEHGYILGLLCIRTSHTYQNGIHKFLTRKTSTDFYNPFFANIGEQPIYNYELFATNNIEQNNQVFGFQEAWAEYRYIPNRTSGYLNSNVPTALDQWTYADEFSSLPVLNSNFMKETTANIDRTLTVSSAVNHQFLIDLTINCNAALPMPTYSIPGGL